MALKTRYVCSSCGESASKWAGQCPSCGEWNTLNEVTDSPVSKGAARQGHRKTGYAGTGSGILVPLSSVEDREEERFSSGLSEFDRVLGGGYARDMVVLMGGSPGAGKSTLLLQSAAHVSIDHKVIYCTGEESLTQIKRRAVRLGLDVSRLFVVAMTDVSAICRLAEEQEAELLIVDSIQTVYHPEIDAAPGGVSQMKDCTSNITRMAKSAKIAVVMVGHITKDDSLAGPMAVKHIVDTTLLLSSNEDARYRILRADKNRYGSVSETGVFAMTAGGMRVVENPSAIFLSRAVQDAPGSVITPLWEGSRPMLIEVQALLDETKLSNPRRVSVGFDDRRIAMLMAVLSRRGGIHTGNQDVYVNAVGGIDITETSADLPILMAAVSSIRNKSIGSDVIMFGEIGLSGEVRPVQNGVERLREAAKMGMVKAVVPAANYPREGIEGMQVFPVLTLEQAVELLDEL